MPRPSLAAVTGWVAGALGTAARGATLTGPSLASAAVLCYGLGEVYRPLMWIAAGCFGLLADRKLAEGRKRP